MKMLKLASAVLALSMTGALAAQAAPGYTTANVNHRTGPDTEFPSMGVIPEGTSVNIRGCLRDESWCDVIAGGNRGWVFSEYLALSRRGAYVPVPDIGLSAARIPIVTFLAANYWGSHYKGRPWFKDRDRWMSYKVRPRAGWRAPPSGPRRPGWWRQGYEAPAGHRGPPDRWRRPDRPDRR